MAEVDHGLALRGGVIATLIAAPAVEALAGDRVYGQDVPADRDWPFVRVDISDAVPDEASGWSGEDTVFTVNGFTRPTPDIPDAEAEARKLAKVLKKALAGGVTLELEPGETDPVPVVLELFVRSTSVRLDRDEPGAYHARVEFSAKTAEEA